MVPNDQLVLFFLVTYQSSVLGFLFANFCLLESGHNTNGPLVEIGLTDLAKSPKDLKWMVPNDYLIGSILPSYQSSQYIN